MVPFKKEISVIVTRNVNGEMNCFPVAENIHIDNILHQTIVPARISENAEEKLYAMRKKLARNFSLSGHLAVEMFLTD